ncbi:MAG: flagellar motor switch protein FliG [Phycisphaerae bacterium]|nr:flagellar motor switch protein FliG [Phycisphaerae bacterium]NUQ44967.1 flagellar motor switch protein FliG [Phycisphaerae bacterium]
MPAAVKSPPNESAAAESPTAARVTPLTKAAVLLVTIEKEAAAAILRGMSREAVEEVSREVASLGTIDPALRTSVVEEFYAHALARTGADQGGLGYARSLLERSMSKDEAARVLSQIEHQVYKKPFSFLQRAESENLMAFIQDEHPQTIALILAHLPSSKAAEVLKGLPQEKQLEVVRRIARMEQTRPEVVKEVERGLEHRLADVVSERMQKVGGVEAVADMLNLADRSTEKGILEPLGQEEPELVEEIRRLMFVFEDLMLIDDRGMQAMLREIETSDLVLALRTATDELKEKVFRNMSERAALLIKEEMEFMGPVRLSDVEAAQQKIVDVVRRLEESGEIIIAGRGAEKDLIV